MSQYMLIAVHDRNIETSVHTSKQQAKAVMDKAFHDMLNVNYTDPDIPAAADNLQDLIDHEVVSNMDDTAYINHDYAVDDADHDWSIVEIPASSAAPMIQPASEFDADDAATVKDNTGRLHVRIYVDASYDTIIDVPKNLTLQQAIDYAEEHLNDIPLGTLTYIPDSDEIDPADRDNHLAFFFVPDNN